VLANVQESARAGASGATGGAAGQMGAGEGQADAGGSDVSAGQTGGAGGQAGAVGPPAECTTPDWYRYLAPLVVNDCAVPDEDRNRQERIINILMTFQPPPTSSGELPPACSPSFLNPNAYWFQNEDGVPELCPGWCDFVKFWVTTEDARWDKMCSGMPSSP